MKELDQLKMLCAAAVLLDDMRVGDEEWEAMKQEWLTAFEWWGHERGDCPAAYLMEDDGDS